MEISFKISDPAEKLQLTSPGTEECNRIAIFRKQYSCIGFKQKGASDHYASIFKNYTRIKGTLHKVTTWSSTIQAHNSVNPLFICGVILSMSFALICKNNLSALIVSCHSTNTSIQLEFRTPQTRRRRRRRKIARQEKHSLHKSEKLFFRFNNLLPGGRTPC